MAVWGFKLFEPIFQCCSCMGHLSIAVELPLGKLGVNSTYGDPVIMAFGQVTMNNWFENTNQTESQLFDGNDIDACNRRSSIVHCNEPTSPCTSSTTSVPFSPSNPRSTSSPPIVSAIVTIDKPIIHTSPVTINGLTVHVPSDLQGALITAPLISISGTLILDLSNFQGDEILLFDGNVEGTFSDLEVIGVSCREVEVQGNTLLIVNTCTTSNANKLAL